MNLQLIKLIVEIAIEVGEHVIPDLIDLLHDDKSIEEKVAIEKAVYDLHKNKTKMGDKDAT